MFAKAVGIEEGERLSTDLAALEETLISSMRRLSGLLKVKSDLPGGPSWVATVGERLLEKAGPIFARRERATDEKATDIRVAALCLAGEADEMGHVDIGDMLRHVAVGITLLERRATDECWAPEVIMLALE